MFAFDRLPLAWALALSALLPLGIEASCGRWSPTRSPCRSGRRPFACSSRMTLPSPSSSPRAPSWWTGSPGEPTPAGTPWTWPGAPSWGGGGPGQRAPGGGPGGVVSSGRTDGRSGGAGVSSWTGPWRRPWPLPPVPPTRAPPGLAFHPRGGHLARRPPAEDHGPGEPRGGPGGGGRGAGHRSGGAGSGGGSRGGAGGTVILVDGNLEVRGTIRGDVVVTDGRVSLPEGGLITGNLRLANGELERAGGTVEGSVRLLGTEEEPRPDRQEPGRSPPEHGEGDPSGRPGQPGEGSAQVPNPWWEPSGTWGGPSRAFWRTP
jgi:hypothetical protein